MAAKRMLSIQLIHSGKFSQLDMRIQFLYIQMCLHADDDGVVEGYRCLKLYDCTKDDLNALESKQLIKYVIEDELVVFITDWLVHNMVQLDRKKNSIYLSQLLERYPDTVIRYPDNHPKTTVNDVDSNQSDSKSKRKTKNEKTDKDQKENLQQADLNRNSSWKQSGNMMNSVCSHSGSLELSIKNKELINSPLTPLSNADLSSDEEEALNLILKCSLDRVPYDKKILWARKHGKDSVDEIIHQWDLESQQGKVTVGLLAHRLDELPRQKRTFRMGDCVEKLGKQPQNTAKPPRIWEDPKLKESYGSISEVFEAHVQAISVG